MPNSNKNSRTREYWAFRLGRLTAQLPRRIEQAYFHDSYQLQTPSIEEPPIHVRDKFPSVDWIIAEFRKTLVELRDNGPSNLRKAAEDALKSFGDFEKLILDSLQNGAATEVAEVFSELQDICQPHRHSV